MYGHHTAPKVTLVIALNQCILLICNADPSAIFISRYELANMQIMEADFYELHQSLTFIGYTSHSRSNSSSLPCLPLFAWYPPYIARELCRVADIDSRRRLRSASTFKLNIPPMRRVTVGDRAFGVAAARVWNSLPSDVTASPSLSVFKRRLKTSLFSRSFDL